MDRPLDSEGRGRGQSEVSSLQGLGAVDVAFATQAGEMARSLPARGWNRRGWIASSAPAVVRRVPPVWNQLIAAPIVDRRAAAARTYGKASPKPESRAVSPWYSATAARRPHQEHDGAQHAGGEATAPALIGLRAQGA